MKRELDIFVARRKNTAVRAMVRYLPNTAVGTRDFNFLLHIILVTGDFTPCHVPVSNSAPPHYITIYTRDFHLLLPTEVYHIKRAYLGNLYP